MMMYSTYLCFECILLLEPQQTIQVITFLLDRVDHIHLDLELLLDVVVV